MQHTDKVKRTNSSFSMTFFLGMAVYMTIVAIAGFWPTYFGHYLFGQELRETGFVEMSWKIHIHTFVFMAWMFLLISQTMLVAGKNIKKHVTYGRYGAIVGILVVIFGLAMAYFRVEGVVAAERATWSEVFPVKFFLDDPFVLIFEFGLLLSLGMYYRKKPAAHKRYMLFATIAIMTAAASRLHYILGPWRLEIVLASAILPIWMYDLYKDKKIHSATLIGTGIVCMYILRNYLV